jgi:CRP-like cAMP-binding protein
MRIERPEFGVKSNLPGECPLPKQHETLEKVKLLRAMERGDREAFERRCQWRHAHPKEWLLEQNDIGTDIYFLTSGVVRVLITPSPDREIILGDIESGGYFGEMAAIDGQPRSAGILAITDATIARMPATVFREIIHNYPDVAEQLLQQLVARIRALDQRVNEFSSMHVKNRIWSELLRRSRPDPTDQRRAIVSPPPVHSEIAARVSTRREMVARELKAMERAGLLAKRRGAFVLNNVPELMQKLQDE